MDYEMWQLVWCRFVYIMIVEFCFSNGTSLLVLQELLTLYSISMEGSDFHFSIKVKAIAIFQGSTDWITFIITLLHYCHLNDLACHHTVLYSTFH